ncbi:hypothetical protein MBEHAL_2433 [Halarchaeum acidiphilum MH1-52-1]|uniref:RNase III domain-containing protein n=1 Tax=Halarchaeum acidiphilum MH1-52-1 TaxID=1261545 RepID=U3AFV9_9EURY|nr:hypothetical protein MBEHAL_2433 [Halarchaeum acidiphilum MH1-52-1]
MADHRAAGRTTEAAVGEERDVVLVALPDDGGGDAEHLAHAGTAARAFVPDDDDVAGLDLAALHVRHRVLLVVEDARGPLVMEALLAGDLEHAAVRREVAGQDLDRALLVEGVFNGREEVRVDLVVVREIERLEFLGDRVAGDGHRVAVEVAALEEAADDDWDAPDVVEVLHDARATGLEVRDLRRALADLVELLDGELNARLRGEREDVQDAVRGPAERDLHGDGVLEGLLREDVARAAVVLDGVEGDLPGLPGDFEALLALGERGRGAEGRETERLADGGHRVRGEHPTTGARAGTGLVLHLDEFLLGHVAGRDAADALEDVLHRYLAALVVAGHDRPAVEEHRGKVGADGGHHHAGEVLVAAADGDERVHALGEGNEFDGVRDHLARDERGLHALRPHRDGVADGDGAELDGHAALLVDADGRGLGDVVEVDVAGRDVRGGVRDADHRR